MVMEKYNKINLKLKWKIKKYIECITYIQRKFPCNKGKCLDYTITDVFYYTCQNVYN